MKINLFPNLQSKLPFYQQAEFSSSPELRRLHLDYADTKRNGDTGTPVMRFGNRDTMAAVARAMKKTRQYPVIAEELEHKLDGRPSVIDPDPDTGQVPLNQLHEQPAMATREFLGRAAAGEFPELDGAEVEVVKALDETTTKINHIPQNIDEELAQLVELESLTRKSDRAIEERTPHWTAGRF